MQTLMKLFEVQTFKGCVSTYIQSMFEHLSNVEIHLATMAPSTIQITHLHQQASKQH